MKKALYSLLLPVLYTGCHSLDSQPPRPTPSVETVLAERARGAAPSQVEGAAAWWSVWLNPELDRLARQVQMRNTQLGAALVRLDEARARLGLAQAEGTLTVQSQASARLFGESAERTLPVPGNPVRYRDQGDSYRLPLEATWELDLWGRVRSSRASASATYAAQEYEFEALQLSLTAEAIGLFLARDGLQREQEVLKTTLAHRDEQISLLETRWKAGLSPGVDLERARTEKLTLVTETIDLERRLQGYDVALGLLTGDGKPYPRLNYASPHPVSLPSDLPAALLGRRPDLRAAEEQINARTAEIGVARAAFFPQIWLTGAAGFESVDLGALLDRPSQFWQFGPGFSYTFLDGGRNRRNLEAARARAEAAHLDYTHRVLAAFREFSEAVQDFKGQRSAGVSTAEALTSARETVALAETRYRAGLTAYFDVLDAQRTELNLRRSKIQVETQEALALLRVLRALGGGWTE